MTQALQGRVAVVTGGGRGVGREHCLQLASHGAMVVVNDLGAAGDGTGADVTAAESVVAEIEAMGGQAIANTSSVTSFEQARTLIESAADVFGDVHVVVCNAGILRDRMLANMSEAEFDSVLDVHVKGTFNVVRHAAAYWRDEHKAGRSHDRSIITTTSHAGMVGPVGQVNYAGAKSAIATMTISMSKELGRYGVRANSIAPLARTRLITQTPGSDWMNPPEDSSVWDLWDPANISPFVAYLATDDCPFTGQVFGVHAGTIARYQPWSVADTVSSAGRWTVEELRTAMRGISPTVPIRTQLDLVSRTPL